MLAAAQTGGCHLKSCWIVFNAGLSMALLQPKSNSEFQLLFSGVAAIK